MITLRVTRYHGVPPEKPLSASFDIEGGTVGRTGDSTLSLPDPGKRISRLQARVSYDGHGFLIVNEGSNPGLLNGRSLGRGRGSRISPGDQLVMGPYELVVDGEPSTSVPGFGLDGLATEGAVDDPLRLFGGSPVESGGGRVGREPSRTGPAERVHVSPPAEQPRVATMPIPEDFDPFAPPKTESPLPDSVCARPSDEASPFGIEFAQPSLDDLYRLNAGPMSDPFGPSHPLSPRARGEPGARSDLLPDWEKPAIVTSGSNLPEVNEPMELPRMVRDQAPPVQIPPGETHRVKEIIDPLLLFPVGSAELGAKPAESPEAFPAEMGEARCPPQSPTPPPQRKRAADPRPEESATLPPVGKAQVGSLGSTGDLLSAFLDGAGVRDLDVGTLTPALMRLVGQLLREATQGAYALLYARRITKHELRLEQTTVEPQENNPLKFSPDAEAALRQLLLPRVRGFTASAEAMRDAFDDLEAHHFGVMAGIRAALGTLLQRFDPEELEQRLGPRSVLDSMLPMNRNARLWELFRERYQRLRDEAEEDFHSAFGRAFVRAYEEQIERLRSKGNQQK